MVVRLLAGSYAHATATVTWCGHMQASERAPRLHHKCWEAILISKSWLLACAAPADGALQFIERLPEQNEAAEGQ
jgi:hypothetical protein